MDGGASSSPCSIIYAGPNMFSEPEARTLSEYISTIGENLHAHISFQTFLQLLMLPYGYTNAHLDNYDELVRINTQLKTIIKYTVKELVFYRKVSNSKIQENAVNAANSELKINT